MAGEPKESREWSPEDWCIDLSHRFDLTGFRRERVVVRAAARRAGFLLVMVKEN